MPNPAIAVSIFLEIRTVRLSQNVVLRHQPKNLKFVTCCVIIRFFAEFTLSEAKRFFTSFRLTESEGMIRSEGLRMTDSAVNRTFVFLSYFREITQRRGKMSMLISTAVAECVSAPAEIRSTPVSAITLTFSKLILPEASIITFGF